MRLTPMRQIFFQHVLLEVYKNKHSFPFAGTLLEHRMVPWTKQPGPWKKNLYYFNYGCTSVRGTIQSESRVLEP